MKVICGKIHLCVSVLCFIKGFVISSVLEWIVDDAVYITAEVETRSPDESSYSQFQDSSKRLPGKCLKFKECYPIFFLTDRKNGNKGGSPVISINSDLVDFILETAERCAYDEFNVSSPISKEETYVWCRLRGVQLNETSKFQSNAAVVIGTKAENEDGILCGQIPKATDQNDVQSPSYRAEERVVGGKEFAPGEAPYSVQIFNKQTSSMKCCCDALFETLLTCPGGYMLFRGKQVCGASIIDEYHILTAAHCVSHLKPNVLQYLRLFIGDHDIKNPSDTDHQERNVSKIIYHKEFSSDTLHDDIAMIKLSAPVDYTGTVSAVCLKDGSQSYEDGNTFGKLVGWGQISDAGERPLTPRTADLRIWRMEDCEEVYDGIVPDDIMEKAFCAGGFQDGGTTDACRGDSGGPLTLVRNNKIEQIGIVSFGVGCGRYPGVFTKASEYQSWIDRHRVF